MRLINLLVSSDHGDEVKRQYLAAAITDPDASRMDGWTPRCNQGSRPLGVITPERRRCEIMTINYC